MRFSLSLFVLGASVATAATVPKAPAPAIDHSAFPTFKPIPFEDAKAGKDLKQSTSAVESNSTTQSQGKVMSLMAAGDGVSTLATPECNANPNYRIEWRSYPAADRLAFVNAIKCLIGRPPSGRFPPATNRYEDFVRLHQLNMPNIHGNAKFLLWHRYYLWTFEQVLRAECGFTRPLPWWDETLDAGRFAQSDMFTDNRYFGHLPSAPNCIVSGAFAGLTCNIGPGTSNTPHCLTRRVDESQTSQCNSGYVNLCNSRTNYADMASCNEGGFHAFGHNGIGSVMSDVSASPSDPIFWMHHSFIDHAFRIWQNGDVGVRTTTINGVDRNGVPLTMDTMIYMGDIRPNVRVRDILDTMGGVNIGGTSFCYRYNY